VFSHFFFFWVAQYCLSKIPHCAWWRAIKRPRTRPTAARQVSNVHERDLVTNQNVKFRPLLGQTYLLESLFSDPVREQLGISASGDRRILVELRSIKVSHVLLCLWRVPSHLTCLSFVSTEYMNRAADEKHATFTTVLVVD